MRLVRRFLATVGSAACVFAAACGGSAGGPVACADLTGLDLIDLRIGAAETVPASDAVPAHCRVTGVIETEINFELLLPDAADWNGRLLMGGGDGFAGSVQNDARTLFTHGGGPLERGYATVGTDTGHAGQVFEAGWALDHPERQENFGHRAIHLTAEAAKSIAGYYYDRAPDYSYFVGCSRGGGQGMVASQRYPDDFDGIVAAAPAYDWTGAAAAYVQNQQAIYPDGDFADPVLTPAVLELLGTSVLAACDDGDGVEDGILNDPRQCGFRPADLPRCPGARPADGCVTEAQLAAIQTVYRGATVDGKPVYPGAALGGEHESGGWDFWVVGSPQTAAMGVPSAQYAAGTELFKHFVFGDPDWDYTAYDFAAWDENVAATAAVLNATDTDLGAFRDRGGRILYWSGWSDLTLAPFATIAYYEALAAGDPAARDYARLYMLPGVLHCAGGPGPDRVDWVEAIRAWVEEGQAPDRLVASKLGAEGDPTLTRPLCPYPQVAVYAGTGDPSDEASFACVAP